MLQLETIINNLKSQGIKSITRRKLRWLYIGGKGMFLMELMELFEQGKVNMLTIMKTEYKESDRNKVIIN